MIREYQVNFSTNEMDETMPTQHLLSPYISPQPGSFLFCAVKISGKGVSMPKNNIGDKDVRLWQATFCGRRHAEKFSNHICSNSHCDYAARVSRLEEFKSYVTFNPSLFGIQEGSFVMAVATLIWGEPLLEDYF